MDGSFLILSRLAPGAEAIFEISIPGDGGQPEVG
jgi:hypothetical protein